VKPRSATRALVLCLLTATALIATACSALGLGGVPDAIHVTTTFPNVSDLTTGAPVQLADLPVGQVSSIKLSRGYQAKVTLAIRASAHVPSDVTAVLRRATLLGQRIVVLEINPDASTHRSDAPLRSGQVIPGRVDPGIQTLLTKGAAVLGAIDANDIAEIIHAGAQGFGRDSEALRSMLYNLASVARGYAGQKEQISSLVSNLDSLSSELAPQARSNAAAISNLETTTKVLSSSANQLLSLLKSLNNVATQLDSLLSVYFPEITGNLQALSEVAQVLSHHQEALAELLHWIEPYDNAVSHVTHDHFVQVLDDLVLCGVPLGGGTNTPPGTCVSQPNFPTSLPPVPIMGHDTTGGSSK
jgi:phospholipid/cholesterol/gamma-HCH transport system substrate-binding protein